MVDVHEHDARLLRDVSDFAVLVMGREPAGETRRLESMRRRLIDGQDLRDADYRVLARLWRDYGRELIELRDPELD